MTEGENQYVIKGNFALVTCKIPSFVADFVDIVSWVDNLGNVYSREHDHFGKLFFLLLLLLSLRIIKEF